ncbi:MAG TPA: MlaD family protein [Solirubrobacteraceae bacterium]|nr:MlaD family protein [Solirubrobacteraceae bacterium]
MKRILVKFWRPVATIFGLIVLAAVVSGYILGQQNLRFPWQDKPVRMYVDLENAQAVTPGQGQSVQVAGVKIGLISGVTLKEGRARVAVDIEKQNKGLIREDAKAMLRPRTPLKDMYIQILPGSRDAKPAGEDFTIPVRNTTTDVDLDEILSTLDERTRDYLVLLAEGAGSGLDDRGSDLAELFRRFEPTAADLRRVNTAVGQEHRALRRLVTSIADINGELAKDPDALAQLVDTSAATFTAFASEDDRLQESLKELPPTLRKATRTLNAVRPFARELRPLTRELVPAVRRLDDANERLRPFAKATTPVVEKEIRPFAKAARPLVTDLAPAATDLSQTIPEVNRSARVANRFFNMLTSNPDGAQGPEASNREEGFLFWLAWLFHQSVNLQNVEDANGPMRPIFLTGTCGTLTSLVNDNPLAEFGLNLSPILATACGNPETTSIDLEGLVKSLPKPLQDLFPLGLKPPVVGGAAASKEGK